MTPAVPAAAAPVPSLAIGLAFSRLLAARRRHD
jgi:hypothetical protein